MKAVAGLVLLGIYIFVGTVFVGLVVHAIEQSFQLGWEFL
jgi:hypothetical protein